MNIINKMAAGSTGLTCTVQEVLNCALPSWYDQFKGHTVKTSFVALSSDFISYLKEDRVFLPKECSFPLVSGSDKSDNDSGDNKGWSDEEEEEEEDNAPSFPELTQQIAQCIADLGGKVFPKLNWSSPRDAAWVSGDNTLQCTSPADVYLLLKSSDFIQHDLSRVFEYCRDAATTPVPHEGYTLCLRKWLPIHPGGEFRCFVRNNRLIAISQRDVSTHYEHMASSKESVREELIQFYKDVIHKTFASSSYVFDVYQTVNKGRVVLLDFNPFCEMTDALLFTWEELRCGSVGGGEGEGPSGHTPELRVVEFGSTIRPSDLSSSRVPKDIIDISSKEDIEEFVRLFQSHNTGGDAEDDEDTGEET